VVGVAQTRPDAACARSGRTIARPSMSQASASKLSKTAATSDVHLRTICQFSLNQPPLRAKVDRQCYDELKPGVTSALALLDWFDELKLNFAGFLGELARAGGTPSPEHLQVLIDAIDACVVLENQFSGWSACVNRFSWFKRTITQVQKEVASDPDSERINKALPRFQKFIGEPKCPIGMHITGPLREQTKTVAGHEPILLAALNHCTKGGGASPEPSQLRPLPYLLYFADGEAGGFNVFATTKLTHVQKVFKRFPIADCGPPPALVREMGLAAGHPVHLGTVLARCPHYSPSMRAKWGMPKQGGESSPCVLL